MHVCSLHMQQHVLSRASSTSISETLRVPSRASFSVMMSEGTSSQIVSPSSSEVASHLSHGNITVSDPYTHTHTKLRMLYHLF